MFVSYIDHERIALGNEEGLFVVHVTKDGKRKFTVFWNIFKLYVRKFLSLNSKKRKV